MKTLSLADRKVNPNIIAVLEAALEEARAGKFEGVVILGTGARNTYVNWGGVWSPQEAAWVLEVWKHEAIAASLKEDK